MGSARDNYTFANQRSMPAHLQSRLPAFFRSWDNAASTDEHAYLSLFSPTGTLQFGQAVKGRDAIKSFRTAMVHPTNGPVVDLQHTLGKCFVLAGASGEGEEEVIVNGTIWYKLKNGRKMDCSFSSWMVFREQEDEGQGGKEMLADYYEVYLDAHELMTAIGEMNEEDGK